MDRWILLALTVGALFLFVTQWIRVEVTALLLVFLLAATGLLPAAEAFSGLSNPATITVAAMFVLSAGLMKTGVLDYLGDRLGDVVGGGTTRLMLTLGLLVAVFSAFINNTPVVVMMIPVVMTLCRRFDLSPSRLLIPLSYFSILGGTCTLIGTSTNILVHSLHQEAGGSGFGMFDFVPLGLVYLGVGAAYLLLFGPRLLPDRPSLAHLLDHPDPEGFVTEVDIGADSRWAGEPLRTLTGEGRGALSVIELIRDGEVRFAPTPHLIVRTGDVLLVRGKASAVHATLAERGITPGPAMPDAESTPRAEIELNMVEAVVVPGSRFVNRELQSLRLSTDPSVRVLGVRRMGGPHVRGLRRMRLLVGDVLLLQGERAALLALRADEDVMLVEGVHRAVRSPRHAPVALGIMGAVIALATFEVLPIAVLALGGAAAMILSRCLTLPEAARALDGQVLLLLAGAIPLGMAMEATGAAGELARVVLDTAGAWGPVFVVSAVYLLTSVMTEFLSNNATAVLLTPIALGVAAAAGIDPRPLLVAITFGASASFATPIGYQTNTMVMGPGGYLFRDFLKIGLPLNVLLWVTASLLIPVMFPLNG